jgi:hypothetical protein
VEGLRHDIDTAVLAQTDWEVGNDGRRAVRAGRRGAGRASLSARSSLVGGQGEYGVAGGGRVGR